MERNENKTIRLLVVDDHPLVRKGIILCLAHCENMEVVGELDDPSELLAKARELRPDVVLMDIMMPQMNGLAATDRLIKEFPETKVLVLSISENPDDLHAAMQAGARGYIFKGTSAEELGRAVETVHQGSVYFSPQMMCATLDQFSKTGRNTGKTRLTVREQEVLVLIADGLSNKETAAELGVSVRTVETHREHLMHKLDIHSAAGLTRFAIANGFVPAHADRTLASVGASLELESPLQK